MAAWNLFHIPDLAEEEKLRVITRDSVRCLAARWLTAFAVVALALPVEAKKFSCAGGDAACLIEAITAANANGKANTIMLSAGIYALTAPGPDGQTGLPVITGKLTIVGEGAENYVIERNATQPFRIFKVIGDLSLRGVTVRYGGGLSGGLPEIVEGGCILSRGHVAITDSVITNCQAREGAGLNASEGTILNSTIAGNTASVEGGGAMGGSLEITDSTIVSNVALFGGGVNVGGSGKVTIVNSTLARNSASRGSAIHVGPPPDAPPIPPQFLTASATIANSTIAENISREVPFSGRAVNTDQLGPTMSIKDSVLANNIPAATADCPDAAVTSLGFNLVGNAASCPAFLRSNDIQGDPGLGAFVDDGTPGHGYFPLLPDSPAIDAGGAAPMHQSGKFDNQHAGGTSHHKESDCPATDQIGQPREGNCDIGAIELVADRVSIRQARFDSSSEVLFVSASSSAARDDVSLAVSVEGCLVDTPMLRVGRSYLLLTQPTCGNLDGATVMVTSSGGGSATAEIRQE